MVKPPVRTPKKPTPTKPKKTPVHQDTDSDPIFLTSTVVAIPGREAGLNFKLVKLLEDVYEESENVQVIYLKPYEDPSVLNCYYEDTIQGEICDRDIICQPELEESKMRIKGKGIRAFYKMSRQDLIKVKSLTKNFKGVLEDESGSEELDEEEVVKPARPMKKVAGRKGTTKKAEEKIEEEEQKTEPAPKRGTRAMKAEEVTRSIKKQKVAGKKGKSTKDEEIDEEEEDETKKSKKGKKDGFQRVLNHNIEVIEHSEMLESGDPYVIDYGSTRTNNKNIIRAVYTKNYTLLEECLSKENFFSTHFERWGVDTNFNAFELALKQGDKKALQLLCSATRDYNFKYAPHQESRLSTFEIVSHGTSYEKAQNGQRCQELNATLAQDEVRCSPFDNGIINTIAETVHDMSIMDILRGSNVGFLEYQIYNTIETILLAGNFTLAAGIVERCRQQEMGLTETHELALTATDPIVFKEICKIDCNARTADSNTTPIHFACINPFPSACPCL